MVEIEVHKAEPETGTIETTTLDINEIISKVKTFVDNIKNMQGTGEPMAVSVEGFNFSVGKNQGEYDLTLKLNLSFKPKTTA